MGLIEDIENAAEEIRRESAKPERLAELLASYSRLLPLAEKALVYIRDLEHNLGKKIDQVSQLKSAAKIKGAMPIRMGGESTKSKRRSMKNNSRRRM